MRIVERKDLDVHKWDELVSRSGHAWHYNETCVLDTLSENWECIIQGDYEEGMALPYTVRLGVKQLVTPNFIRGVSWLGAKDFPKEALAKIEERFQIADLSVSNYADGEQRVYQVTNVNSFKLNKQASRKLAKAKKMHVPIMFDGTVRHLEEILAHLSRKGVEVNAHDKERFKNYVDSESQRIRVFSQEKDGDFAELVFLELGDRLVYLKGAASELFKANGAMYLLMNEAIAYCLGKGKYLDYGGSNVKGVQQFNHAFGAEDITYHRVQWNRAPGWFRFAKKLKSLF